jgi:two-component system, OmpR family, response regulator
MASNLAETGNAMAAARRVLLIDDDTFFLTVLSDAFRGSGFEVVTARDGRDGVRSYLANNPDVVIVDLIMPVMGGVSTCMEITRFAGDSPPILILLTSMFHGEPHEHETPDMGARIHIPKSVSPLDIVILVEQLLDREDLRAAGV